MQLSPIPGSTHLTHAVFKILPLNFPSEVPDENAGPRATSHPTPEVATVSAIFPNKNGTAHQLGFAQLGNRVSSLNHRSSNQKGTSTRWSVCTGISNGLAVSNRTWVAPDSSSGTRFPIQYLVGLREFHPAEALRAAIDADEDISAKNVAGIAHVVLEIPPIALVRQVADKNLFDVQVRVTRSRGLQREKSCK